MLFVASVYTETMRVERKLSQERILALGQIPKLDLVLLPMFQEELLRRVVRRELLDGKSKTS